MIADFGEVNENAYAQAGKEETSADDSLVSQAWMERQTHLFCKSYVFIALTLFHLMWA